MRLHTGIKFATLGVGVLLLAAGCSNFLGNGDGEGVLSLSLTDAPVDADNVESVNIQFEEIQYHRNGQWETFDEFDGPRTIDVLALSGGETEALGDFTLPEGRYTQIRFMLGIGEKGDGNEGSYISFNDGTDAGTYDEPLFVPSGQQSGYKAIGNFSVPANGTVSVTADFDLRRAVVETGDGDYILRPTLRLVVDDQAGAISGSVTNTTAENDYSVFAYESGDYDSSEADLPGDDSSRFDNAVGSSPVEDGSYKISFLAEGDYDLVLVEYDSNGDFVGVVGDAVSAEDVTVSPEDTTQENLDAQ